MSLSIRDFNIGLYLEHLDEAAFLYTQRKALLLDDEIWWPELDAFERRLEAHLDALIVGGELALAQCVAQLAGGDAGVLFAAVCVICRHRRSELLAQALRQIDHGDSEQVAALTQALKWELPQDWGPYLERAIASGDMRLTNALAEVAGYRRLPLSAALMQALAKGPSGAITSALAKIQAVQASAQLEACLKHDDPGLQAAALLALLYVGSPGALQSQYLAAQVEKWPRTALALGGSRRASMVFVDIVQAGKGTPECLLALGLLGELSAMRTLYQCLSIAQCAGAAALALNWITGADLYEDVFMAEQVQEDELFDKELLAWKAEGKAPLKLDGTPFGQRVKRLSTDPQMWGQWWGAHQSQFDANLRYRSGKPYSPHTLWQNLADQRADRRLRRLAAHELQIRYQCGVPFEVDMPVRDQIAALQAIGEWVHHSAAQFTAGAWYVNGQRQ
jgi:uncharacterized protein (TIGR02270 family)